jgi:aryl-alcohol dehydrogenase-like predicted oxidoreductase
MSLSFPSKLVFGTGGRFGRLSRHLAQSLVDYSISKGISKFDTGHSYCGGNSQRLLFSCLAPYVSSRDSTVLISTKVPPSSVQGEITKWVDQALGQLRFRDYIDTLFLWGPSEACLYNDSLLAELHTLKQEGKVRLLGINTHDTRLLHLLSESSLLDIFDSVLLDFNLVQQDRLNIIRSLSKRNVSVWAGTALCQGFLNQSFLRMLIRTRSLSYSARALLNPPTKSLLMRAKVARSVLVKDFGANAASIPLSFVLSSHFIDYVPVGMLSRRSIDKNLLVETQAVPRPILNEAARKVAEALESLGL